MDSTVNSEEPGRGDARLARLAEQLSSLGREAPHHPSDPPARTDKARTAVSSNYTPLGGRPRRAFAGLVLVACVSIAAILYWLPPSGDTAKTAPPPPAPLAQATSTSAVPSPELTELSQSMARDLATVAQQIEQLRAGQEQLARENAKLAEQFKTSQEQTARLIATVSEQVKSSQEQMVRDNANMAEQFKASQEKLDRVISQVSEQNGRAKIVMPRPRPTAIPAPNPSPTPSLPQARAPPQASKPQLSSASRRPAPVH